MSDWIDQFEWLEGLEPHLRTALVRGEVPFTVEAGTVLFQPGDGCTHYIVLCAGVVRVDVMGPQGKETLLYRLESGDSCVVTTAALLGKTQYFASARAETSARIVRITDSLFQELLEKAASFRNHVFASQGRRIIEIAAAVGAIVNERIDQRLAQRLLQLGQPGILVHATHETLARDIGTAREVVSRNLANFAKQGWVELGRGVVSLKNKGALRKIALDTAATP